MFVLHLGNLIVRKCRIRLVFLKNHVIFAQLFNQRQVWLLASMVQLSIFYLWKNMRLEKLEFCCCRGSFDKIECHINTNPNFSINNFLWVNIDFWHQVHNRRAFVWGGVLAQTLSLSLPAETSPWHTDSNMRVLLSVFLTLRSHSSSWRKAWFTY